MEAIMIHPENAEQLKTVKSVLKALKVPFEPQSSALSDHVMASIDRGMEQELLPGQTTLTPLSNKGKHVISTLFHQ